MPSPIIIIIIIIAITKFATFFSKGQYATGRQGLIAITTPYNIS